MKTSAATKIARRVWKKNFGPIPDGYQVDHKDGNNEHNDPSNLRLATHTQNQWNRRKFKNNTSGEKGVKWGGNTGKWQVKVYAGSIRVYQNASHFISAVVAARLIRRTLHGEFSRS